LASPLLSKDPGPQEPRFLECPRSEPLLTYPLLQAQRHEAPTAAGDVKEVLTRAFRGLSDAIKSLAGGEEGQPWLLYHRAKIAVALGWGKVGPALGGGGGDWVEGEEDGRGNIYD
jgi:hypothetical protein